MTPRVLGEVVLPATRRSTAAGPAPDPDLGDVARLVRRRAEATAPVDDTGRAALSRLTARRRTAEEHATVAESSSAADELVRLVRRRRDRPLTDPNATTSVQSTEE